MKGLRTLTAIIAAACAPAAGAIGYMPDIEQAEWQLERSPLMCRLVQQVPYFGAAEFRAEAGEAVTFSLTSSHPIAEGTAELRIDTPPWRHEDAGKLLAAIPVFASREPVLLDAELSEQLLVALYEGQMPVVAGMPWQAGAGLVDVSLSAVNFQHAYHDYRDCIIGLIPARFADLERTRILFEPNQWEFDDATRAQLDMIIRYIKADRFVQHVYIDGYTDDEGRTALNRELSKRRAETVATYLTARGVADAKITTRFHGERFAPKQGASEEDRKESRRVTIRLERI